MVLEIPELLLKVAQFADWRAVLALQRAVVCLETLGHARNPLCGVAGDAAAHHDVARGVGEALWFCHSRVEPKTSVTRIDSHVHSGTRCVNERRF